MSAAPLEALRKARVRIDALDAELVRLIAERAQVASEIRDIKAAGGATEDHYRPAREAAVLRAAMQRNEELGGLLPNESVARLMREIMSVCLALESPLTVAYLGPEGTYTQTAVHKHFGHAVDTRPRATIDEIFREVESNNTAYGVVPVENSTEGVVNHTLDRLAYTSLNICGEVWLPIHHHLLSHHTRLEEIRVVYAHAHSFGQCRQWLDSHVPQAACEPLPSNGVGAKRVAELNSGAAIAGQSAAELYGLPVLAANIEDDPNNTTRFLVIGRKVSEPTGRDKTSVVMQLQKDRPGALVRALEPLAIANIDLTRIESRPSRQGLWEYNFFIDFEGHQDEPQVRDALTQTQQRVSFFKVLGSYPRAVV
jgi:chorismate mutase/prephenate dehydratase